MLATRQEDTTRRLQCDPSLQPRRLLPPRVDIFIWISTLFSFIFLKLSNSYFLPWKDSDTALPQARWWCPSRSTCRRWAPCRARPQPTASVTPFTHRWPNIESNMFVRVYLVMFSDVWHDHPQHGQHPQAAMRKYQCKMCPQVIFAFVPCVSTSTSARVIILASTSK